MGVVTNQQLAARRRKVSRRIERAVLEAERRSPGVIERQARIRAATRNGRAAFRSRQEAQRRLADALRRLIHEGLSISEASERVGLPYHEARRLIRAAEVADGEQAAPPQTESVGIDE